MNKFGFPVGLIYSLLEHLIIAQHFAYKIECSYFFKLFVLAKCDDKSYHI